MIRCVIRRMVTVRWGMVGTNHPSFVFLANGSEEVFFSFLDIMIPHL